MKIDWDYIQREWDWLGHIVEGLIMSVVVGLIFGLAFPAKIAVLLGLAFAIGTSMGARSEITSAQ